MELCGRTKVYGIIGNPIEHTLSPVIHNTLAQDMGIEMVYVPFYVEEGQIEAAVKGAYGLHVYGMNVTVPYKRDVLSCLVDIDIHAKQIGAVNTLARTEGGYIGYNTDFSGLWCAMKSDGIVVENEEIILLGAGGVGRMVAFMCAIHKAAKVYLLNRNIEKAQQVATEVNKIVGTECITAMPLLEYEKLVQEGNRKYLVIQCTSIGMSPDTERAVIEDEAFYRCVKTGYDLIYTPWETKFMRLVRANGGMAYNGLKMLLYQGIDAFEIWNGCKVPQESVNKVYEKLQKQLRN